MSFSKNLTITVRNTVAQLDEPLYVYEKDRNLIMYFKIMDYKYKFDKNPTNVLASVDDIMEAYATIVDPNGYELTRQYGEVIEDEIKFVITDDLIDELDEIGTYRIQFHIKCQHSEFTIPEISFEVLERLKGFRTVTDEGEVGDEILNNSESFIDAEGKLHLVWQEGDTISSVRLNQMVQVINNAVDEEHQRQLNEVNRENRANAKLNELETRFSALTTSQQQSAEVIDARDGEASLKARLDRDIKKPLEYYENVEGSYISTDSSSGYLKDVEILGNTIQNEDNLADIRSVGDKVEGQELYEIPVLSVGKNLLKDSLIRDFTKYTFDETYKSIGLKVEKGKSYIASLKLIDSFSESDLTNTYFSVSDYCNPSNPSNPNYHHLISKGIYAPQKKAVASNDGYIYFCFFNQSGNTKDVFDKLMKNIEYIQLEEGTVATPYEPYQEDKLTILSPTPLEKVGDVADRIIEKDGVWGVEKNVKTIYTKEFAEDIGTYEDKGGTHKWGLNLDTPKTLLLTNFLQTGILSAEYTQTQAMVYNHGAHRELRFAFKKSDFPNFDVKSNVVDYLSDETRFIKIVQQPQFIPLPHDQQIKLRTFANKTNISFLTEIEGTIKAQVPKSLGATVNTHTTQISNLNKELDRVKKLEESTVSTVETESDFTTVEATSNGYFEDVKLEGKTLVNLPRRQVSYYPSGSNGAIIVSDSNVTCYEYEIKPNTTYTIKKDEVSDRGTVALFSSNSVGSVATKTVISMISDGKISTIRTGNEDKYMLLYVNSTLISSGVKTTVLEGDHTQNPPSYFEGLKSVGQSTSEDGVDEISVESVNENLFDGALTYGYTLDDMGSNVVNSDRFYTDLIEVKYGITYSVPTGCVAFAKYTENKKPLGNSGGSTLTIPYNCKYIRIICSVGANHDKNIMLTINSQTTEYTPHQSDKKRLLYYNNETQTWEKTILREWDSVKKHSNGKYYYHQRSGEVVLNGSEDNWIYNTSQDGNNTNLFYIRISNAKTNQNYPICDRFNGTYLNLWHPTTDIEGTLINHNKDCFFRISKSKLSTQDVAGFKAWLQANNVTVVYQLAEEKVYECTNIDLITYANETNYIVESGAITPKTTLKVHSNIANVINALQKKVSVLESNYVTLFNTITAAFNSLE